MVRLHRQWMRVTSAVLLIPSALFAQEQSGAISGRVIDRDTQQPIASAQIAPSTAPAAPSMCPVIDFVDEIATR